MPIANHKCGWRPVLDAQLTDWGLAPPGCSVINIARRRRAQLFCSCTNTQLIDWGLLPRAALGVLALLAGNGYIVGINQIYDVEVDTINKPFLPVAAGEHDGWC